MKTAKAKAQAKPKATAKAKTKAPTLAPNAFIGKSEMPTEAELAAALGPSKALWDQLVDDLARDGVDVQEWNSYSPKAGWSLRLKRKERNIVYLGPFQGGFRVAFVLGDKAVKAARQSKLPARVLKIIAEAPRYPEGTGVRMLVNGPEDVEVVKQLALIKLEN
jgi:Protein of unknown function (DUF3788)